MDHKISLTNGGYCVVFVGQTGFVREYATEPRVLFINCKEVDKGELSSKVPVEGLKVAIITEGIPQWHYMWITSLCSTKKIPYLIRKSNQAVYETLKSFFTEPVQKATSSEVREAFEKGKLVPLIPLIDFAKSNAENASNLLREAQRMGIKSTKGSLAQFVSTQRRKQGQTGVPRSIRSKLDVSVDLLDQMIKDLEGMRDYLIEVTDENRILKAKHDKFKQLIGD